MSYGGSIGKGFTRAVYHGESPKYLFVGVSDGGLYGLVRMYCQRSAVGYIRFT